MGTSNFGPIGSTSHRFIGGEGQIYLDNVTLYGQGGHVDFEPADDFGAGLDDGLFVRGVLRWFVTTDSRIRLEGPYINADYDIAVSGLEAFSVGARCDFTLMGMPIIGDTSIYLAHRGTFRDGCLVGDDVNDHTLMIGTYYSFSGDLITVNRQGATLDTPDFNHSCAAEPFN